MKKIYMLVNIIDENKGGMTTAMLDRSKVFYEHSYPADIITFDYNLKYEQVISNLKSVDKMDRRTKIYNMFNHFEKKSRRRNFMFKTKKTYNKLLIEIKKLIKVKDTKLTSRYYSRETGECKFLIKMDNNEIQYLDCYEHNKRCKRIYFDKGAKRLTEYFNQNNRKTNEVYFNELEQPYLNRTIHPEKQSVQNATLIAEGKKFKNNRELASYFIDDLLDERNDNVLICDGPGSLPRMIGVKTKNVKKIAVIHTNHFSHPYKYGSPIKKREDRILKSANKLDQIVVLTEKQKKDIVRQFKIKNITVIPNFKVSSKVKKKQKSKKIVGSISRLHKNKGLDRLLKVAKLVKEKDSSIKFHIYGSGNYKKQVSEAINKSSLNENVILKGYTNNVKESLATFDISVSTSYFEGFGLSIAESMEQRVPVIAMDINYGPSDLIENGINGYLVLDNDIEDMANKIVETVQDKKKIKKLGKNARKKILNDLNSTTLVQKWESLM